MPMSRAAALASTASWWSPSTDCTFFIRLTNRCAFLPRFLPSAGSATSAA